MNPTPASLTPVVVSASSATKVPSPERANKALFDSYAKEAHQLYGKTAEASITFGRFLKRVREDLTTKGGRALWRQFSSDPACCPVSYTVASRLITIAEAEHLNKYLHRLPSARESVYEIATFPADKAKKYLETGAITPQTTLGEIKKLKMDTLHAPKQSDVNTVQQIASQLSREYRVTLMITSSLGQESIKKEITRLVKTLATSNLSKIEVE